MGLACQRTVAIVPPPLVEGGSLWIVARGDRSQGSTFVHASPPGEALRIGPVAFDEALEIHAFHQRCTLPEIFGAAGLPVSTGELELKGQAQGGRVLPTPLRTYRSQLSPELQTEWSEEAISETIRSTLARAPLPDDHGCQMGVSDLSYDVRFIKGFGKPGTILHPRVSIAVGTEKALLALSYATDLADAARVGHGVFEFPVNAMDGAELSPIRESDTASHAYFGGAIVGQDVWLHRSGHLDRLDLSREPWRFEDSVSDTFTASVNLDRIEYQSQLVGSRGGEAPEILMLSTQVEFNLAGPAIDRPTILRGFDPTTRRWTVYFEEVVQVRGPVDEENRVKEVGLQRLGPGEAVVIGLDGDNTHLFHLRAGVVTRLNAPALVTRDNDLVRIYRPPAVGTLVATRQGAIFQVDLEGPTWTLLKAPYQEDSEAAQRGDISDIWASAFTPEGIMFVGPRPGRGAEAIFYRPGLGFCGTREVGLHGSRRSIQFPDRHIALLVPGGANTLEVRSSRLLRPPLDCAAPSGM